MSLRHSTKPAAPAWPARVACALGLLLIAVTGAAEPLLPTALVRILPAPASAAAPARLLNVYGRAPARCAPAIAGVTLDGTDLSIDLGAPQTNCDAKRTVPFNLRIDPATSAGVPLLPGHVYRARVYAQGNGLSQLIAFHLLDTHPPASAPIPESGFWWSQAGKDSGPASVGTGASLEWQDGQLAVGLFGFAASGAPTWSFGSTRLQGRAANVALVQLANGDPPFAPTGSQPSAEYGPRLEIEFLSPTRARAWVVRHDAGRDLEVRAITLSRSQFANGPTGTAWSGQWVLIADDNGAPRVLEVRAITLSRSQFANGPTGTAWSGQWVLIADDNGAPRVFEFADPSSQDAETFHLADAGNDASLDCRLAEGTQQPGMCTLSAAALPLADFDQVGLDRLSGRSSDGARVKLIRVPR